MDLGTAMGMAQMFFKPFPHPTLVDFAAWILFEHLYHSMHVNAPTDSDVTS